MDAVKTLIQEVEHLKSQKLFDKAIEMLQWALSQNHNDYRIYEEIADIYLYEWKILKAKKAVDFALNMNHESSTWNYLKWFILLASNKTKEAIEFLEKSNLLMPNNAEVLRNLGWAYSMNEEKIKWILVLKRALNISPNDHLIQEDLAMALIWYGRIKEWNDILKSIWKTQYK
jgi:tetratricopeptide (TPR) repeat protein